MESGVFKVKFMKGPSYKGTERCAMIDHELKPFDAFLRVRACVEIAEK